MFGRGVRRAYVAQSIAIFAEATHADDCKRSSRLCVELHGERKPSVRAYGDRFSYSDGSSEGEWISCHLQHWTPDIRNLEPIMNAPAMFNSRNRAGGEFLLLDAATAHSLLDIAGTTRDTVEARRDMQLAHETLDTMKRYLQSLEMDASLRAVLERSRDKLELRLAAMERRFAAKAVSCP